MEIYWIGMRESEVKYTNFIKESITIFGNDNISMQNKFQTVLDHNNTKNFAKINDFFNDEIKSIIKENREVKFMYYNQINQYRNMEKQGLLNYVICLNKQDLVERISNKFELKKYFNRYVPILNYKLIKGKNCKISAIQKEMHSSAEEYVLQTATGSGGSGTFIINRENENHLDIDDEQTYMVTAYCKKNIPTNIHVLIAEKDITLLPPSIQIIEICNHKLAYKGCDFIAYRKHVSSCMDTKLQQYSKIIAEHLQKMGYRGICGIDYILWDDEVYLMEINARFQNSSTILNKALLENNLPSLQELHYNCFYNKNIELPSFTVNYSCYIKEDGDENRNIKIDSIEELDFIKETIPKEKMCYLGASIFDKSIYEEVKEDD